MGVMDNHFIKTEINFVPYLSFILFSSLHIYMQVVHSLTCNIMLQQIITEYNSKGEFMSDETGTDANYRSARYEGKLIFLSAGLELVVQILRRCSTRDSKVCPL